MPLRRVVLVAAVVVAAACTQETSSPPTTVEVTLPATTTSTTTTVAPTTTSTTSTTTSTTTTEPDPTTTSSTTTTEVPFVTALVLGQEGLGPARFGAEPNGVIDYVVSFLGSPTADTGWVAPDEFALCPGDEVRRIEWGSLRLSFGDVSTFAVDRLHLYAWQYGIDGQLGEDPVGLRTEDGIGLGSTVAELLAAHPEAELYEGDDELFPPGFSITDSFFGFTTGLDADDLVTELFSGYFCGE